MKNKKLQNKAVVQESRRELSIDELKLISGGMSKGSEQPTWPPKSKL